ncbi:MAG: hypothetical protein ACRD1E_02130 [Terriglobales bacterium]
MVSSHWRAVAGRAAHVPWTVGAIGAMLAAMAKRAKGEILVLKKNRLWFQKKLSGRGLHILFPIRGEWFLYPHDQLLKQMLAAGRVIANTESWDKGGIYHCREVSAWMLPLLAPYRLKPPRLTRRRR